MPQEFGLRTDCRWFEALDSGRGTTLRIDVLKPQAMHISATHHTAADLFQAETAIDLPRRDGLVVCLDVAHRGLGTASCGPDVLDRYRLAARPLRVRLPRPPAGLIRGLGQVRRSTTLRVTRPTSGSLSPNTQSVLPTVTT